MTEFLEVGKRVGLSIACFCIVVNPAEATWLRGFAGLFLCLELAMLVLAALASPK